MAFGGPPLIKVPPGIDPNDPAWALIAAADNMLKTGLAEQAKLMQQLTAEVVAAGARAETAAKARAESTISAAGEWAGKQLRGAGAEAATAIRDECLTIVASVDFIKRLVPWFSVAAGLILCSDVLIVARMLSLF